MDMIEISKRERLSALADGELRDTDFAEAVRSAVEDADARATWHAYHVVGDVLRSSELAACRGDAGFVSRFAARLEKELATEGAVVRPEPVREVLPQIRAEAANAAGFRWKWVAGVASLAAVGAIGWNVANGLFVPSPSASPQMALVAVPPGGATPSAVAPLVAVANAGPGATDAQVMIRDPQLDEMLAAHKQFGGTSALQMPAGFLRNATFEGTGR